MSNINKQINNKNPVCNESKKIAIIDWDDTLFPTSWLHTNGIKITNDTNVLNGMYPYFEELDDSIYDLIKELSKHSKIVIVTNATIRWVHISGRVLKKSYGLIIQHVNIISARDLYQQDHPTDVYKWKENAFTKEIHKLININKKTHSLISIGDADYEYKALIHVHSNNEMKDKIKYFKSIKFKPKTDIEVLADQISVITEHIDDIINVNEHLDLEFFNK